jgi:hypothetical protein
VRIDSHDWSADFPIIDEVEDFAGKIRKFNITCHEGGLGFTVSAEEKGKKGMGYRFEAYSETSPYDALGRLRLKMRRGVAIRHLSGQSDGPLMLHDTLRGWITSDGGGEAVMVVDGIPLSLDEFSSILNSHEGWEFELRLIDSCG